MADISHSTSPYTLAEWRSLDAVARQLIVIRVLRSVAQGALAVDFTLYLRARGWQADAVGLLLMAGGLIGAVLGLAVGILSDRMGRRFFLIVYEAGLSIGTLAVMVLPATWVLVATAALFGFGRGANGSSGPFAPAEQAWLAQRVPSQKRGPVFSLNAAAQFMGMGVGSLLAAGLPHLLPGVKGSAAYLPLFALNLLVALVNLVQIWRLQEDRLDVEEGVPVGAKDLEAAERTVVRRENRALLLLVIVNMVNALGVGLVTPLLPYWFAMRFGVGPELIGPVYSLTFIVTGFSSLAVGRISQRIGLVRSIVLPRLLGVLMIGLIPFAPTFALASAFYVTRSIVNRGSAGARQAFSVGLVRDRRRGLASSLNALSWSLPAAIGGYLIGIGVIVWPFLMAAALQLGYVILFPIVMGRYAAPKVQGAD